jgi:alkanesulfonate monooxygenase SsuD/methylene tetrahydromethanopterin reductase-like flavin-dependent oxidoreductase (luciferase family)
VDVLSGGRLIFGIGIGYLKPEFDALGIPFEEKGARSIEYLEAILALWTQPKPAYKGRFVSFADVQALPRPVQVPHPPVVMGGASRPAFRRAVRYADGWYGFGLDVDGAKRCVDGLRAAEKETGVGLGGGGGSRKLELSLTPSGAVDLDTARRFADLGVDRLILFPRAKTEAEVLAFVRQAADTLIGRV